LVLVATAPVPESATVVGELVALLLMVSDPVRDPDALGRNTTETVQDDPAETEVQPLVWVKSPEVLTAETVAVAVPVLEIVTDWAADAAPTVVEANDSDVGFADSVAVDAFAVPESATVVGLLVALLLTVTAPVRVPLAVGRKTTETAQLAPAAIAVPQVLVCVKSPLTEIDDTLAGAVPLLEIVMDCAEEALPTVVAAKDRDVGLADRVADPVEPVVAKTSKSESWPAGQPVLPVMFSRR
jgi:hypothetical protein